MITEQEIELEFPTLLNLGLRAMIRKSALFLLRDNIEDFTKTMNDVLVASLYLSPILSQDLNNIVGKVYYWIKRGKPTKKIAKYFYIKSMELCKEQMN